MGKEDYLILYLGVFVFSIVWNIILSFLVRRLPNFEYSCDKAMPIMSLIAGWFLSGVFTNGFQNIDLFYFLVIIWGIGGISVGFSYVLIRNRIVEGVWSFSYKILTKTVASPKFPVQNQQKNGRNMIFFAWCKDLFKPVPKDYIKKHFGSVYLVSSDHPNMERFLAELKKDRKTIYIGVHINLIDDFPLGLYIFETPHEERDYTVIGDRVIIPAWLTGIGEDRPGTITEIDTCHDVSTLTIKYDEPNETIGSYKIYKIFEKSNKVVFDIPDLKSFFFALKNAEWKNIILKFDNDDPEAPYPHEIYTELIFDTNQ